MCLKKVNVLFIFHFHYLNELSLNSSGKCGMSIPITTAKKVRTYKPQGCSKMASGFWQPSDPLVTLFDRDFLSTHEFYAFSIWLIVRLWRIIRLEFLVKYGLSHLVIVADTPSKSPMKGGVIAGIVLSLVVLVILVVLVCVCFKKKKKSNHQGGRNSAYTVYCEYSDSFFVCFRRVRSSASTRQIIARVVF